MKITQEHQDQLFALLDAVVEKLGLAAVQLEVKLAEEMGKGLATRWNILWAVPQADREPVLRAVYEYANDEHIDTVLRKYVTVLATRTAGDQA